MAVELCAVCRAAVCRVVCNVLGAVCRAAVCGVLCAVCETAL